jgi:DNA-binding PadR family transcriptional regulator
VNTLGVYERFLAAEMSVPHALLGLLEDGPLHGYELKRSYDGLFGRSKPLPFGQVYSTLARLARDGLVEVFREQPGRGPDRKIYAITQHGVTDLDSWLADPEPAEPYVQSVLFMKVLLSITSGRSATDFLEAQRVEHEQRMRDLTRVKQSGDIATQLVVDYALYHLDADLKWIELTHARLARLRKELVKR